MLVKNECDINSLPKPILGTSSQELNLLGPLKLQQSPKGKGLYRTCTARALQRQVPWRRHYKSTANPLGFIWKGYNSNYNRLEEQQGPALQGNSEAAPFPIKSFCSRSRTAPQQVTGISQRALAPPKHPAAQH